MSNTDSKGLDEYRRALLEKINVVLRADGFTEEEIARINIAIRHAFDLG